MSQLYFKNYFKELICLLKLDDPGLFNPEYHVILGMTHGGYSKVNHSGCARKYFLLVLIKTTRKLQNK